MDAAARYEGWTKSQLIARVAELEAPLPKQSKPTKAERKRKKEKKDPRPFDIEEHPCRKVALRFSYDGSGYSGLAAQNGPDGTSLSTYPTVESVLWEALVTARLVDPEKGMDGAGWSRCGRTDRGVSAAGQVAALWVRSKAVNEWPLRDPSRPPRDYTLSSDELSYVPLLNRILPPTIRIQAWSPVRPNFSARFDCVYRHYKYFFTLGHRNFGRTMDLEKMRQAARMLLGEHDFRNMCKVDPSKQIVNYRRRIDGVSIDRGWPTEQIDANLEEQGADEEPMYVLNLRGTAFLYHQVRNIVAVLFLVGAGLEKPSIVQELMNVQQGTVAADRIKMQLTAKEGSTQWWLPIAPTQPPTEAEPEEGQPMWYDVQPDAEEGLAVYDTKPNYEMASDRPLVLYECGFLPSDVQWQADIPADIHSTWIQQSIKTEISRHFILAAQSDVRSTYSAACFPSLSPHSNETNNIPLGNGFDRGVQNYIPISRRMREDDFTLKNKRWMDKKTRAD